MEKKKKKQQKKSVYIYIYILDCISRTGGLKVDCCTPPPDTTRNDASGLKRIEVKCAEPYCIKLCTSRVGSICFPNWEDDG